MVFGTGSPRPVAAPGDGCGEYRQVDEAEIRICDVVVSMTRRNNLDVPAEFSAFIPRAEIRRRFQDGRLTDEEIILSSITIVHSPRHRSGNDVTAPSVPGQANGWPSAPARRWDDQGTWGGAKVAALERSAPRVTISNAVSPLGEGAEGRETGIRTAEETRRSNTIGSNNPSNSPLAASRPGG